MRKRPDKKYGGFFWACSDPDCHTFFPDNNGKPGAPREKAVPSEFPCPVCNQPLYRKEKEGNTYWACYNREGHANGENVFLPDDNGKPGKPKPRAPRIVTEFVCPVSKLEQARRGRSGNVLTAPAFPPAKPVSGEVTASPISIKEPERNSRPTPSNNFTKDKTWLTRCLKIERRYVQGTRKFFAQDAMNRLSSA